MPIDVEKLALDAGLPAAIAKKFRRDRGQEMTEPEKEYWANVERFAALVLEAAAVECGRISEDRWAAYKNRPPYEGNETTRYSMHTEGESDGADLCEAAIRAMKPGESNE